MSLGSNNQSISLSRKAYLKARSLKGDTSTACHLEFIEESFGPGRGREQPNQSSSRGGRNVARFPVRQRHPNATRALEDTNGNCSVCGMCAAGQVTAARRVRRVQQVARVLAHTAPRGSTEHVSVAFSIRSLATTFHSGQFPKLLRPRQCLRGPTCLEHAVTHAKSRSVSKICKKI